MECRPIHLWLCPQLHHIPEGEARERVLRDIWLRVRVRPTYIFVWIAISVVGFGGMCALILLVTQFASSPSAGGLVVFILPPILILLWRYRKRLPLWLLWRAEVRDGLASWSRQHEMRICAKCGYELGTNESPFCPECGAIVPFLARGRDRTPERRSAIDDRSMPS